MKYLFTKLRTRFKWYLKILWTKLTEPFQLLVVIFKRHLLFKKNQDNWEKHVTNRELINQNEFNLRRKDFFCLKIEFMTCFFITSMLAGFYAVSQEHHLNELDDKLLNKLEGYRKEFYQEKTKLIKLMENFNEYNEIAFDKTIKAEIIAWEFETFNTNELSEKERIFADYFRSLDIIQ